MPLQAATGSASERLDALVLTPAFVFASRGCDGLPPSRAHKQGSARLYIYGSGSIRIDSKHSVGLDTSDPCTQRCASTGASFQHSAE